MKTLGVTVAGIIFIGVLFSNTLQKSAEKTIFFRIPIEWSSSPLSGCGHRPLFVNTSLYAGGDGKTSVLNYRFDYTFLGQARGVFLMVFRYRFFLCATASVLLEARAIGGHRLKFNYAGIDTPGCLMRTTGFRGKGLITAAAHINPEKTDPILANDMEIFKKNAGDFARFIKRRKVFSFRLIPRTNSALTFTRAINGVHRDAHMHLEAVPVKNKKKVDFYFKIYPLLLEMIKTYNHAFYQGDWNTISKLRPNQQWHSRDLDYSNAMNRLSACTTKLAKKYIRFKQKKAFKMLYRVISRTSDCLTIEGSADPQITAWANFKIMRVIRTIRLRIPDGIVMEDKFYAEIYKREGNGGIVQCALKLAD